jgi:hypothetical protein
MDTSATSRAVPPSDVFVPRAAADVPHSENPPEKTVTSVKGVEPALINERRQEAAKQAETQRQYEKRYELQDKVFVYSVSDARTGAKVVQYPSEQAVKLRHYLQEQDRLKAARQEEAQKEEAKQHLDIVA